MTVTVTGGAGYVGALVVDELLDAGREVPRARRRCCTGRRTSPPSSRAAAWRWSAATSATPTRAAGRSSGADAVVHLAAIVGDPACARDPELSNDVNVEGSRALVADARELGVERLVFASTCSNYGRMADPTVPIDETGELRPVSLYAEQKVGHREGAARVGERQRPRAAPDLPALRHRLRRRRAHALRPHRQRVHARPLGRQAPRGVRRAVLAPLHPRARRRPRGRDRARGPGGEGGRRGLQRRPLRRELPQARPGGDHHRHARPRRRGVRARATRTRATTRSRSRRSAPSSASSRVNRVPDGIDEIVGALEEQRFGDPFDGRYRN